MHLRTCLLLALCIGCTSEEIGTAPPRDKLFSPTGIAAHPDGQYLYVANAGFERSNNGGTLVVYDTYAGKLVEEATTKIGLFAGEILLARRNDCEDSPCETLGYISTRDDNTLTSFVADPENGLVECGQKDRIGKPKTCDKSYLVDELPNGNDMLSDPYGLSLSELGLAVSHVAKGEISIFHQDGHELRYGCDGTLTKGATSLAWHPRTNWLYVTDRYGQTISVLTPRPLESSTRPEGGYTDCEIFSQASLSASASSFAGYSRGIAFSADGSLLYILNSAENSLWIYDTSLDDTGKPRHVLVKSGIPAGAGANVVRVAGLRAGESRSSSVFERGAGDEIVDQKGEGLVYVTALNANRISVIDPDLRTKVADIETCKGPHDLAFMPDESGALRGYVTCFEDDQVGILDLEPGSETRFTMLGYY